MVYACAVWTASGACWKHRAARQDDGMQALQKKKGEESGGSWREEGHSAVDSWSGVREMTKSERS